jgi:hypothetical protein
MNKDILQDPLAELFACTGEEFLRRIRKRSADDALSVLARMVGLQKGRPADPDIPSVPHPNYFTTRRQKMVTLEDFKQILLAKIEASSGATEAYVWAQCLREIATAYAIERGEHALPSETPDVSVGVAPTAA